MRSHGQFVPSLFALLLLLGGDAKAVPGPVKLESPAPDGAELVAWPIVSEAEVKPDALFQEFSASAAFVVRTTLQTAQKLKPYDLLEGQAYRMVLFDKQNPDRAYVGIIHAQDPSIPLRIKSEPGAFAKLFDPRAKQMAPGALAATPASTPAQRVNSGGAIPGVPQVQPASVAPMRSANPSAGRTTSAAAESTPPTEGWLERFKDFFTNTILFLAWLIVTFACPVLFLLAWRHHRKLVELTIGLRTSAEQAQQEIARLRQDIAALTRGATPPAPPEPAQPMEPVRKTFFEAPREPARERPSALASVAQSLFSEVAPPAHASLPDPAVLADAFRDWCNLDSNATLHEAQRFAQFLEPRLGATPVDVLYRDRNAGPANDLFTAQSAGLQDPTEYWHVRFGEEDLLFPRPDFDGFSEISPAFDSAGSIRPQRLRLVVPGRLRIDGSGDFRLREKGRLS